MPSNAKKLIIEFYDASDSNPQNNFNEEDFNSTDRSEFDDDDKIFYTKIGKTEVLVDKILQNLLVSKVIKFC